MGEPLQFRISSALKDVIGKDLITDDFVAIFELVKNSFDAFAEKVTIHFYLDENQEKKIFIVDNGKGMSKQDIIDKWLFVAFSAKKEQTEDKIDKKYSGFKGIGRFSCDRLGQTLKLYTTIQSNSTIHCINVNWDDFEKDAHNEFINIDVDYQTISNLSVPEEIILKNTGVVLEIGSLRDEESWTREKLIKLKRSLQKLIDPVGEEKKIIIHCKNQLQEDEIQKNISIKKDQEPISVNGEIKNTIFKVLENKTTNLKAKITSKGKLEVELIDRGTFIYKTEEDIRAIYPDLIDSSFYMELSFLNRSSKTTFNKQMGIRVREYGSLFLLRNGFRVYPIGEENNDYWGFDHRKQQGYARYLGSRELLGFVKISGIEDKFRESSSRNQGLIQTNAAKELSECVNLCLVKFEAYVVDVTWKDKIDKENSIFERMSLDNNRYHIIKLIEKISNSKKISVIDYNHDLISILNDKAKDFEPSLKKLKNIASRLNDNDLIHQTSLAEKALLKAKIAEQEALQIAEQERQARFHAEEKAKVISKNIEKLTQEKSKLKSAYEEEVQRNLFLTGSNSRDKELLEGFIHQIILYASEAKGNLQNILQFPNELKEKSFAELQDIFSNLLEIDEKIISTSRFATTANFRLKSSMITEDFNAFLLEYLEKIASAYNSRIQIATKLDSKKFVFKFNPIEMGMVLENFISNSKKARASKITFSSSLKTDILEITIEDNGKGIDKQINEKDRIFEKGFTRTDGSGLGLYFCKNQIEAIGGEVKLSPDQPSRGAVFVIRMVK